MAVLGRLNWRFERWTLLMPDGRSMSTGVAGRRWDVACAWAPPRGPPSSIWRTWHLHIFFCPTGYGTHTHLSQPALRDPASVRSAGKEKL